MNRSETLAVFLVAIAFGDCLQADGGAPKPNVLCILADDLGYGDVQAINPTQGKIATPHLNQLASEGIVFTDAHSSSSVCTPTRYALLTGRYNWRTKLQRGVLSGYSPPMIDQDRLTVAGFLRQHGYSTACIGKWHLGMSLPTADGSKVDRKAGSNIDWTGRIENGPIDAGFDYFYGISASLDMPPYIYIENDRFVGECTTQKAFYREGHAHADFEAVDVLPELGRKVVEYIERRSPVKPFFLYVPLTSPHTPIVPTERWRGSSGIGDYGDFVRQTDAAIGRIVASLDGAGLAEKTLVIVTSDNGCSKAVDIPAMIAKGHHPSGQFRGSKADLWEGGHRVPFIARWRGRIDAGSRCDQTIGQLDLLATCADLLDSPLPVNVGEDSASFLPAFSGDPVSSTRRGLISHSISGHFAYREGRWKLLLARGSGGWTSPRENEVASSASAAQLYDLERDPGETNNLFESRPEIAARLLKNLKSDIQRGRSTNGPTLTNDVDQIVLWKSGR